MAGPAARAAARSTRRPAAPAGPARSAPVRAPVTLRGILASERRASGVYAEYTQKGCEATGIRFELVHCPRLEVEDAIERANQDASAHGIIVYYPVFGGERDRTLQDVV